MTAEFGFRYLLGGILITYVLVIAVPGELIAAPVRVALLGGVLLLSVRARRKAGALALPALILSISLRWPPPRLRAVGQ